MSIFDKSAKHFFSPEEGKKIVDAIHTAEQHTSGEIRVHLENHCLGTSPVNRARKLFTKLKMEETAERNGVLIYLAVKDHKFAILGDEGINEKVPENFWDDIVDNMGTQFKQGQFLAGLTEGISTIGKNLKEFFPREDDDINELPDDISYG